MGASLSNIQLDKEYLLQAENTEINLVALSSVFVLTNALRLRRVPPVRAE